MDVLRLLLDLLLFSRVGRRKKKESKCGVVPIAYSFENHPAKKKGCVLYCVLLGWEGLSVSEDRFLLP